MKAVIPAKAGIQNCLLFLDSGFRRNDRIKRSSNLGMHEVSYKNTKPSPLERHGFDSLHRFFEAFFLLCQSDAKIPFSRFTETIARRDDHTLFKQARRELR